MKTPFLWYRKVYGTKDIFVMSTKLHGSTLLEGLDAGMLIWCYASEYGYICVYFYGFRLENL